MLKTEFVFITKCVSVRVLYMYLKALDDLVKTLVNLANEETTIIMSYEERETGKKPLIEKTFFQVEYSPRLVYIRNSMSNSNNHNS